MENAKFLPSPLGDQIRALDGLLGSLRYGALLVDEQGRLRWANEHLRTMGLCQQALEGLASSDGVAIEGQACLRCALGGLCLKGRHEEMLVADEHESASMPVVYSVLAYPLYDEAGGCYMLHVLRDMSQPENVKKERHELFLMLSNVLDNTVDAVLTLDADSRIHSWNYGAWQLFGYSKDEVRGQPLSFLIPQDAASLKAYDSLTLTLTEQGFVRNHHARMRAKDRRYLDVALTQTTMRNPQGEPLGHSLIIRDVSKVVTLERKLSLKVGQLQRLLDISTHLRSLNNIEHIYRDVLIAMTVGDSRLTRAFLLMVNPDMAKLRGVRVIGPWEQPQSVEEPDSPFSLGVLLRAWQAADHTLDEQATEAFKRVIISLGDRTHPLVRSLNENRPYIHVAGSPFDEKLADLCAEIHSENFVAVPLVWQNRQLGLILADNADGGQYVTSEDMQVLVTFANQAASAIANIQLQNDLSTKVAELQKTYQSATEMQREFARKERLAALGAIAAKVAHEMRNPLASMGGFARLLEKHVTSESGRKHLAIIISEILRLERILNQVLDSGRPVQATLQPASVNDIISEIIFMTDKSREDSGIKLHPRLDPSLPTVIASPDMLRQAFLNIIRNAMEAMGRDGVLSIETYEETPEWVIIRISDTGIGIPADQMAKLFSPFFTTKARGVGLGLSITRQMIEQLNGTINVTSRLGEGTSFEIKLPQREKEVDHDVLVQKETADRG